MKEARKLLILGTWIVVLPFLGVPYSWQDVLIFITGLILLFFSYSKYKKERKHTEKKIDSFRENFDFLEKTDKGTNTDKFE